jgi:hypothetical protein
LDKSIIVPVALFIAVVYSIKLLVDARMRFLFFKGGSPETVQALFMGEERLRRQGSLRWGLVMTALALGLSLASAMDWQALSLPGLATILAALGVGNLVSFAWAQRLDRPPVQ